MEIWVSDMYEMWHSLYRKYAMMFEVTLICCKYSDILLLMRIHTNDLATVSCISYLNVSNCALYIHEMSMKAIICVPGIMFWMVMYMDVDGTKNYRRLSMEMPWNSGGMWQHNERPLSLYPPMQYLNALDHSVTFGAVNKMLFI